MIFIKFYIDIFFNGIPRKIFESCLQFNISHVISNIKNFMIFRSFFFSNAIQFFFIYTPLLFESIEKSQLYSVKYLLDCERYDVNTIYI